MANVLHGNLHVRVFPHDQPEFGSLSTFIYASLDLWRLVACLTIFSERCGQAEQKPIAMEGTIEQASACAVVLNLSHRTDQTI